MSIETTPAFDRSASRWPIGPLLALAASAWAAMIVALAVAGVFDVPPDQPAIPVATAVAVPVLLFLAGMAVFARFRAWALALDPVLLTSMQAWRVVGAAFLIVYAFGGLPGFFAWPAGLGDIAVGLAAPFVVWRLLKHAEFFASARFRLFHYAGLFDFAVAVVTGIASRNQIPGLVEGVTSSAMGQAPLVLIPALAVPAFIILHLIVLMQVRARRAQA